MPDSTFSRCCRLAGILACLLGAAAPRLHAATPVYADPALTCAGLTPCFATLQEAVDNAGPAPAEVGVFPGIYGESVDLSAMGSAIAGGPGDISVQALDAAGQPATSGVLIDPAGPGGPGTGPGLSTGFVEVFPGDITICGLASTSPDTTGLGLFVAGDLVVEDVILEGAGQSGMVALVNGDATIARVLSQLNGDAGIGIGTEGTLTITDVTALQNMEVGILADVEVSLFMDGIESSQNAAGILASACDTVDIRNVIADMNTGNGVIVRYGPDDCMDPMDGVPDPRVAWPDGVLTLDPADPPVFSGTLQGMLVGEQISASGNGIAGIGIGSTTGAAVLNDLYAYDNPGPGMFMQAADLDLTDAEALRNGGGVLVIALEADLLRVVGSDSLPMPVNPPFDGSGVVISASQGAFEDIQADDNPQVGLLMTVPESGGVPDYELVGSQFTGNSHGVATGGGSPVNLIVDTVDASANLASGFTLPNLGVGSLRNVTASGNPLGMVFNVSHQLVVETSEITANDTGVMMAAHQPTAYARIGCSNITGNTTAGVELAQGPSMDAPANWWGDSSGPTHPGNPAGTGDTVLDGANGAVGTVNYDGFLAQPATEADCPQGVPQPVSVPALGRPGIGLLVLGVVVLAVFAAGRARGPA